jgi:serine/threonine protein kinase
MSIDETQRANPDQSLLKRGRAALARLGFGDATAPSDVSLSRLPADARHLDLSDPAQRELGDYELLERIGQGGMGVVYRARQRSLDREVAIKIVNASPWAARDFAENVRREARSAARMQHPHIVTISARTRT